MKKLTKVDLSYITKKIELNDNRFIVLVDTTENTAIQDAYGMKNIFCINNNNEIFWQVSPEEVNEDVLKDTFMYMDLSNSGELNADTFFGMEYCIDLKAGIAKKIGWHK